MAISSALELSRRARGLGIKTIFKNLRAGGIVFLPQQIAVIGQGATASTYATTKAQLTSAFEVGTTYGFGSPIHLAALQLLPANGDGVGTIPVTFYPLDDDGSGVASDGDITPAGAPTKAGAFQVKINNIVSATFVISVGDAVADIVTAMTTAITAALNMPMTAVDSTTKVDVTSKWKGTSANDLVLEVDGPTDIGVTFAFTQPVGGLVNPDVDLSLAQVGNIWETLILNCMDIADTASLVKYDTFGEGRWGALVRKPAVVFTGNTNTTVANATAVSDARKTDRTNAQLVAPGSNDLPFVVAARQLARIAVLANNNPPHDYGSQQATGLTPGTDAEQWDDLERDQALKLGSSSIEVKDGVVNISDVVTFFHPDGDTDPEYRYVVDIIKLQNVIFNVDLIYAAPEWDGAPLIPDNQATVNRTAKKPKNALTASSKMTDNLGLEAILSDPAFSKANMRAEIDSQNPKRLNHVIPVKVSGNTNVKSIDLEFGFFFGTSAIVN